MFNITEWEVWCFRPNEKKRQETSIRNHQERGVSCLLQWNLRFQKTEQFLQPKQRRGLINGLCRWHLWNTSAAAGWADDDFSIKNHVRGIIGFAGLPPCKKGDEAIPKLVCLINLSGDFSPSFPTQFPRLMKNSCQFVNECFYTGIKD